jgi:hypothetical protein
VWVRAAWSHGEHSVPSICRSCGSEVGHRVCCDPRQGKAKGLQVATWAWLSTQVACGECANEMCNVQQVGSAEVTKKQGPAALLVFQVEWALLLTFLETPCRGIQLKARTCCGPGRQAVLVLTQVKTVNTCNTSISISLHAYRSQEAVPEFQLAWPTC